LDRLSRAHERFRRQTDGRAIAYSERELRFAKNGRSNIAFTEATVLKTTEAAASVASNVATALSRLCMAILGVSLYTPLGTTLSSNAVKLFIITLFNSESSTGCLLMCLVNTGRALAGIIIS